MRYTLASFRVLIKSHLFQTVPLRTCRKLGMLCVPNWQVFGGQVSYKEE